MINEVGTLVCLSMCPSSCQSPSVLLTSLFSCCSVKAPPLYSLFSVVCFLFLLSFIFLYFLFFFTSLPANFYYFPQMFIIILSNMIWMRKKRYHHIMVSFHIIIIVFLLNFIVLHDDIFQYPVAFDCLNVSLN